MQTTLNKKTYDSIITLALYLSVIAIPLVGVIAHSSDNLSRSSETHETNETNKANKSLDEKLKTAVFAGGCFWCMESDFEKLSGVKSVVSGYIGGSKETANYKQVSYTETGHYEAVEITYDQQEISYQELLYHFWRNIDPTDQRGQFCDKGSSYLSAIFYSNELEFQLIGKSLEEIANNPKISGNIVTAIKPAMPFYQAEEYHQNYYLKNPIRYNYYRKSCGRDKKLKSLWGEQAHGLSNK